MSAEPKRPIIGLTPDFGATFARPGRPSLDRYELKRSYPDAIVRAGGVPIVLPYLDDDAALDQQLSLCDALLVTGGGFDVPPGFYGAEPHAQLGPLHPERSGFELRLLQKALARDLPVLGICGGHQLLAVTLGATLVQDIPSESPEALGHEQAHDPREPTHSVELVPGTRLALATGARTMQVNSTHHQAVRTAGRATVSARSPDGLIEAIELPQHEARFVMGVQWHPELLPDALNLSIYRALVEAALPASRG